MGKSYRVIKAKGLARVAFPVVSKESADNAIRPRLVLDVRFSDLRAKQDPIGQLPPVSAPLQHRSPQSLVQSEHGSVPALPAQQTALAALPVAPRPAELGWRSLALLLIVAAATTGGIYLARQHLSAPIAPL